MGPKNESRQKLFESELNLLSSDIRVSLERAGWAVGRGGYISKVDELPAERGVTPLPLSYDQGGVFAQLYPLEFVGIRPSPCSEGINNRGPVS